MILQKGCELLLDYIKFHWVVTISSISQTQLQRFTVFRIGPTLSWDSKLNGAVRTISSGI
jgi:hypothetical protein